MLRFKMEQVYLDNGFSKNISSIYSRVLSTDSTELSTYCKQDHWKVSRARFWNSVIFLAQSLAFRNLAAHTSTYSIGLIVKSQNVQYTQRLLSDNHYHCSSYDVIDHFVVKYNWVPTEQN